MLDLLVFGKEVDDDSPYKPRGMTHAEWNRAQYQRRKQKKDRVIPVVPVQSPAVLKKHL